MPDANQPLTILRLTAKMQARNLSVLNYANGFTLWHYKGDGPRDWCRPEFWAAGFELAPPKTPLGLPMTLMAAGDILHASNERGEAVTLCFDEAGEPHVMATTGAL